MATFLTLLLVVLVLFSFFMLWRRPFNVASIIGVLTAVFGIFPALYAYFAGADVDLFYSWRNFAAYLSVSSNPSDDLYAILVLSLMTLAFLVGAYIAFIRISGRNAESSAPPPHNQALYWRDNRALDFLVPFLIACWGAIALYFLQRAGSLYVFLLPVNLKSDDPAASGYLTMLYMFLPLVLFVLSVIRNGRLTATAWAWVLVSILTTFSTHQRRELVTTALFIVGVTVFVLDLVRHTEYSPQQWKEMLATRLRWSRRIAVLVFSLGLTLVPGLWFTRVYFTSAFTQGAAVNPFEIRSFTEVMFGSPATGFPTLMLIMDYVHTYGLKPFYTLYILASLPVPRSLWPGKPDDIDTILETTYGLTENPSAFWFGELYFNFALASILAAFVAGWGLFWISEKTRLSNNLTMRILGCVLFMQSITLFKNGFIYFGLKTTVFMVLIGAVMFAARKGSSASVQ